MERVRSLCAPILESDSFGVYERVFEALRLTYRGVNPDGYSGLDQETDVLELINGPADGRLAFVRSVWAGQFQDAFEEDKRRAHG